MDFFKLDEADLKWLISQIPEDILSDYLKRHPKDFQRHHSGFRPQSFKGERLIDLFVNGYIRKHGYIVYFFDKPLAKNTLKEIRAIRKGYEQELSANDNDSACAWITTFEQTYFRDNIALFCKLEDDPSISEEAIPYIKAALKLSRQNKESQAKAEKEHAEKLESNRTTWLNEHEQEIRDLSDEKAREIAQLQQQLNRAREEYEALQALHSTELAKLEQQHNEALTESEVLEKSHRANTAQLQAHIQQIEQRCAALAQENFAFQEECKRFDATRLQLEQTISGYRQQISELQQTIADLQQPKTSAIGQSAKLRRPSECEEFLETLAENLADCGVRYSEPLAAWVGKVAFCGCPMLIARRNGIHLAQIFANTLSDGSMTTISWPYTPLKKVQRLIAESTDRIILLDNYVGNVNETALLSILEQARQRIVFLTVFYEQTLRYLAPEFLEHINYINIHRLGELTNGEIHRSSFEEVCFEFEATHIERTPAKQFLEVCDMASVPATTAKNKLSHLIKTTDILSCYAFEILPYCFDVYRTSASDSLLNFIRKDSFLRALFEEECA